MGKTIDLSPSDEQQKALLAGLYLTGQRDEAGRPVTREAYDRQMLELEELAKACGLRVVGICIQSAPEVTQKTFLGSGKVDEIRLMIEETDADIVLFNESLSPMQVRNLEKAWDTEVLDRTGIILQIFSRRARTREARLQVECARLKYMLPRLAGLRVGLSRQGGGSGRLSNKGAGEEQLELDRRHIEHRIAELERQLKGVSRERAAQRSQRLSENICRVALVGYTNAGTLESDIVAIKEDNSFLKVATEQNKKDIRKIYKNLEITYQKVGLVKYDAFKEMGGQLSFSIALLNNKNDGFILNSVHSSDGCYSYTKEIKGGTCAIALGQEEEKALQMAINCK